MVSFRELALVLTLLKLFVNQHDVTKAEASVKVNSFCQDLEGSCLTIRR